MKDPGAYKDRVHTDIITSTAKAQALLIINVKCNCVDTTPFFIVLWHKWITFRLKSALLAWVCKKIFQRWHPVPMGALLNKRPKASSVNVAVGAESLTHFSLVHIGKLSSISSASLPEHQRFHDNNHKKSWTCTSQHYQMSPTIMWIFPFSPSI